MRIAIRFFFLFSITVLLFSCTQQHHEKLKVSTLSIKWGSRVDSLLHDTVKSRRTTNILKKKILNASKDTDAINKLNELAIKSHEAALFIADEALRQSQKLNYMYGILNAMFERGRYFMHVGKNDSAQACFNNALALAWKTNKGKLGPQALYWEGLIYYNESQYPKAIEILLKANDAADSLNQNALVADALAYLGNASRSDYNYFDALGYYNRAIQAANQLNDSNREEDCISSVGEVYRMKSEYATALFYYDECIKMATASKNKAKLAFCLSSIGEVYKQQADNVKALDYFNQSIKVAKEIDDQNDISDCYGSIAEIYDIEAEHALALEYFNMAVQIDKDIDNREGLDYEYVGMGNIYREERDFKNALKYYTAGLDLAKEVDDKGLFNQSLLLIGKVYRDQGNYVEALNYYNRVVGLATKIDDDENLANSWFNIGEVYSKLEDNTEGLKYYQQSLDIARRTKAKDLIAQCLYSMGAIYVKTNEVQKAKQYADESLKISKESNEPVSIQNAAKLYSEAAKMLGDYKTALDMHELFVKTKDSASNIEEVKKFATVEYNSKEDQLKSEEQKTKAIFVAEQAKNEAELKRQKTLRYAFTIGFMLVLVFMGIIYRGLQQNKKKTIIISRQKEEVDQQRMLTEKQKALVEEKNKEVYDSITYAKRLQDAILPPVQFIEQHLPESFVMYKPKAIIAGDFYWMEKVGDNILIAAADCTGHGVPGALVSVVCSNALNRAVKEFNLLEPGKILDKVRDLVLQTFERSTSDVKDGMDISLSSINLVTGEMKWSGANNPLWYLHNNELKEIAPDKQPIGKHDRPTPFTTHSVNLAKGDTVYLFSDGYADQFGGEKGKKFKYRQLQTKLVEMATLNLKEQGSALHGIFEDWKGMLEQVDDVLMIGIRV